GNSATGCDGGQSGAAPWAQHMVDRVVMNQSAVPASLRAEAFREHLDDVIETFTSEVSIGISTARESEHFILAPLLSAHFSGDLLSEHVDGTLGNLQSIQLATPHAIQQSRAFDKVVARQRKQTALGCSTHRMAGSTHALQERVDGARCAD